MKLHKSRSLQYIWLLKLLLLAVLPTSSFAQPAVGTGAFPKVELIETSLKRGVSTKSDVQRLLGVPNGTGGALLPGFDNKSEVLDTYQIWYYEDIETGDYKSEQGVIKISARQQILAVFFKGDVFHSYFWTSNDYTADQR